MKRYLCLLSGLVISLILLAGCGSDRSTETNDWKPTRYEVVNNLDGVSMIVKEGTVSSTGLTVILENNSDQECTYGEFFVLEKKSNGDWYEVPVAIDGNYGFTAIGYNIAPSELREWRGNWKKLYGRLNTGEYRIIKDILSFRQNWDYDEHILTAEFTIR